MSLIVTGHLQNGAIKDHIRSFHHKTLKIKELECYVKIVKKIQCPRRLVIYEALTILNEKPNLKAKRRIF